MRLALLVDRVVAKPDGIKFVPTIVRKLGSELANVDLPSFVQSRLAGDSRPMILM